MNKFDRKPLPERFCNLDRLLAAMTARGLDGIVLSTPPNVLYLSGFNGIAHKADEPRPYALALSRHAPEHPILVLGGFVGDPGAMVWGHPRGAEAPLMLQTGLEDFGLEGGQHVMFDCHGTLDL